jgi:hypothetical protein
MINDLKEECLLFISNYIFFKENEEYNKNTI